MWLAAIARGSQHPDVLGPNVYAHTSPVWIDVAGRSVARGEDATWCLDWIDRFEQLARDVGVFTGPRQLDDLLAVLDQARAVYRQVTASGRLEQRGPGLDAGAAALQRRRLDAIGDWQPHGDQS